jgi:hypothetical protein
MARQTARAECVDCGSRCQSSPWSRKIGEHARDGGRLIAGVYGFAKRLAASAIALALTASRSLGGA